MSEFGASGCGQLHLLIAAGTIACIVSFVQEKTIFSVEVVLGFAAILTGTAALRGGTRVYGA